MALPDQDYLFGVLKGDGCVGLDSHNNHYFAVTSTDFDFLEKINKDIETSYNYKSKIKDIIIRGNRKPTKQLNVYKNQIALDIKNIKLKNYARYLSGLFDSEGHASYRIRNDGYEELQIGLVTTDKDTALNAIIGLNKFNIKLGKLIEEKTRHGKDVYRIRIKINLENVLRFYKIVNPIIERKRNNIEKYLLRRDKNEFA